ncbi:hypothetical protein ACXR2T_15595 [Leucobacter sp. HY1910]
MQFTDEPRTHDHTSDPAHTPGDGWVDEGGASHLGPATHFYTLSEESVEEVAEKVAEKVAERMADDDDGKDIDDPERDLGRS